MSFPSVDSEVTAEAGFPATHWSVVLAAAHSGSLQAEQALADLCAAYWYPVYAFVRRRGYSAPDAEDLTQEFFARLLKKELLCGLKREGGKFRSYLLTCVKCFLANEWHHEQAQKRGGGRTVISIDDTAETRYQGELIAHATPETLFERQWAMTLLNRVLVGLREEYLAAGKQELFDRLQSWLPGAGSRLSYGEAGAGLQMNEAAVRMAVHRLRRRYGELLRAEIAASVSSPAEINEEIHHLIAAIGQPGA